MALTIKRKFHPKALLTLFSLYFKAWNLKREEGEKALKIKESGRLKNNRERTHGYLMLQNYFFSFKMYTGRFLTSMKILPIYLPTIPRQRS